MWALGDTVERSDDPDLVAWALQLYERVLPSLAGLESPRTLAFVALGGPAACCAVGRTTNFRANACAMPARR
ncbi:hypothetical protein ACFSTD_15760 [Novosphingobium colocasiae]